MIQARPQLRSMVQGDAEQESPLPWLSHPLRVSRPAGSPGGLGLGSCGATGLGEQEIGPHGGVVSRSKPERGRANQPGVLSAQLHNTRVGPHL